MSGVLSQSSVCSVTAVPGDGIDHDLIQAWERLYELQPAPSNPFLAPTWVLQWYDKFVQPGDRVVLVVRRTREDDVPGEVLGILPMHVDHKSVGPLRVARRLLPVGAGVGVTPLELPGLLSADGMSRQIGSALTSALLATDHDWSELVLAPHQGWLDYEWLEASPASVTFGECVRARACVVLPLQPTWDQTRATLKRNIKESIRRSANRLKKDGRAFEVVRHGTDLDEAVVERFLLLHQVRSRATRSSKKLHPDVYEGGPHRRLMVEALPRLGREGRASVFELYLAGEHVASQVALHSPGTSYVHSSGFKEEEWDLGVVTHLQAELVRHAIERGDTVVNFSPGPNVSKLRWSEQLWVTHEFAVGGGSHALTLRFASFDMLSSVRLMVQSAIRNRQQVRAAQKARLTPAVPTTPAATADDRSTTSRPEPVHHR